MKIVNLESPIYDLNGKVLSKFSSNKIETAIKYSELILTNLLNLRTTDKTNTESYFKLAKKIQEKPSAVKLTNAEIDICIDMLSKQTLLIKARFLELINGTSETTEQTQEVLQVEELVVEDTSINE